MTQPDKPPLVFTSTPVSSNSAFMQAVNRLARPRVSEAIGRQRVDELSLWAAIASGKLEAVEVGEARWLMDEMTHTARWVRWDDYIRRLRAEYESGTQRTSVETLAKLAVSLHRRDRRPILDMRLLP